MSDKKTDSKATFKRRTETIQLSRGEKVVIGEVMGDGDAIIEALLLSDAVGFEGEELDEYLATCILTVDGKELAGIEAILDWTTYDRMTALKQVRILSHGAIVNVPWICKTRRKKGLCHQENESPVDLSKIPVREPDYDAKEFEDPTFGKVALALSTGHTEATFAGAPDVDRLRPRVRKIGDGPFKGSSQYPGSFLKKIREHRNRLDGDPGLIEPCVCGKCGRISRIPVICRDFFGV